MASSNRMMFSCFWKPWPSSFAIISHGFAPFVLSDANSRSASATGTHGSLVPWMINIGTMASPWRVPPSAAATSGRRENAKSNQNVTWVFFMATTFRCSVYSSLEDMPRHKEASASRKTMVVPQVSVAGKNG